MWCLRPRLMPLPLQPLKLRLVPAFSPTHQPPVADPSWSNPEPGRGGRKCYIHLLFPLLFHCTEEKTEGREAKSPAPGLQSQWLWGLGDSKSLVLLWA